MRHSAFLFCCILAVGFLVAGCAHDPAAPGNDQTSLGKVGTSTSAASLPPGSVFQKAVLRLQAHTANGKVVEVFRVMAPWDETTVTFSNFAGAYDDTEVRGSFAVALGDDSVDISSLVLAWMNGSRPNYGLLLDQADNTLENDYSVFVASEGGTAAYRPTLVIYYSEGGENRALVIRRAAVEDTNVQDAYIWEFNPNTNYDYEDLYVGKVNNKVKQTLIWFDVPSYPGGCTYTPGYWKTHSKYGPAAKPDPTWNMIGEDTPFFSSGKSYYRVLWTSPSGGNAYYILAHAYIAAKLNILSGTAHDGVVDGAMAYALTFFATYSPSSTLSRTVRAQAINAAGILDNYNNGIIGPGHCEDEVLPAR